MIPSIILVTKTAKFQKSSKNLCEDFLGSLGRGGGFFFEGIPSQNKALLLHEMLID